MRLRHALLLAEVVLLLGLQPRPRPITLALLGDVMLGRGVAQAHEDGSWERALGAIAPSLQPAGLALANLESPLTEARQAAEGYDLRAPAESAQALSATGLDIVSLANNHSLDAGAAGLADTQASLRKAGVAFAGPGPEPLYRTVGGVRLAILAFDDVTESLDEGKAVQAVRKARQGGALVIVSVHWGGEYKPGPTSRQRKLAQVLADAGAGLVWGHHPHVLQPLAWVQGEGQPQPTLVIYSLGNALFDQATPPDATRSAMLLVTLDESGVLSMQALPFEIDPRRGEVIPADASASQAVLHRLGVKESN